MTRISFVFTRAAVYKSLEQAFSWVAAQLRQQDLRDNRRGARDELHSVICCHLAPNPSRAGLNPRLSPTNPGPGAISTPHMGHSRHLAQHALF
jgi:hypothetical protein